MRRSLETMKRDFPRRLATPPRLRHEIAHTETFSAKVNGIPLNVEEISL